MPRALAAAAVVLAVGTGVAHPRPLLRLADPRITEASGIAAGLASPGMFYVQNDSGDASRFFAIDKRTGKTAATVVVAGARNVDWEDIAVAPDAAGTPSVWLADIGDNDAARHSVEVYRVAEPHLDAADRGRTIRLPVAQEWRLRYPTGPTDAEGLAVAPDGTGYVVTKSIGNAAVYELPPHARGDRPQVMQRIGSITFHPTGTANPFGLAGQLIATGATISANGSAFVVRTYSDAWVWRLGADGLGAALRNKPAVVALPRQQQGEGVAVVGSRLVVDSEGARSPVFAIALPPSTASPGARSDRSSGPRSPTGSTSTPPSSGPRSPTSSPSPSPSSGSGTPRLFILAVLLAGGLLLVRTASRARRSD
jgi:hypothetical protein